MGMLGAVLDAYRVKRGGEQSVLRALGLEWVD